MDHIIVHDVLFQCAIQSAPTVLLIGKNKNKLYTFLHLIYMKISKPIWANFLIQFLSNSKSSDLECPLFASDNENVESAKNETNTEKEVTSSQKDSTARRKRRRVPTIQSNVGQPHPFYECIVTLRCLLLRDAEPQKWAAIQQMMDHLEV